MSKEKCVKKSKAPAVGLRRLVRPSGKQRTEADWCVYRCQLSCKIGRDALDAKIPTPDGCSRMEYAIYNLLHAVEELSKLRSNGRDQRPGPQDA